MTLTLRNDRVGVTPSARRAAGAIAAAALYLLLCLIRPGAPRALVGNSVLVGFAVAGFMAAIAAWRRTRDRAWILLAGFCVLWAIGQAVWAFEELLVHRAVLFPSPADAGYLGAAACAIAASTQLPRRSRLRATIAILDGLVVALSLIIIVVAVLEPVIAAGHRQQAALGIVYPASDIAVLTAIGTALPAVASRWRPQVLYVLAAFVAIAAADVAFAVLAPANAYATGQPIDLGWVAGFALIAAAARRANGPRRQHGDGEHRWAALLLPHLAVVPAAVAFLAVQLVRGSVEPVLVYLGVAVASLAALRHAATFLESERRAAALDREATYDSLTGLWNRRMLTRTLDHVIDDGDDVTVVVVDIDDFKNVNDSLGPPAGDRVLRDAASRLRACFSADDLVARLDGDEFAVVLRGSSQLGAVIETVTRLCHAFAAPFTIGATVRRLTVSIGIAVHTGTCDASGLVRNADIAMYSAKRRGKNGYAVYEPQLHADAVERVQLMADFEHALDRDELVLYYQPSFRLSDGSLLGAEALIRWRHPTRGLLQPNEFLPLIDAGPHVEAVGLWVLRKATRFAAHLLRAGLVGEGFHIAVNVSARQLYSDTIINAIDRALAQADLPASALVIELTESSIIDVDHALPALTAIRARGVRLAVDDFGTGYSSLSYLHRLPLDILKIDRSFVAQLDENVELRAMTRAILTLGRSLGLMTVAEGVERLSQLEELRARGCTAAQGYLWSPPVSGEEFAQLLTRPMTEGRVRRVRAAL